MLGANILVIFLLHWDFLIVNQIILYLFIRKAMIWLIFLFMLMILLLSLHMMFFIKTSCVASIMSLLWKIWDYWVIFWKFLFTITLLIFFFFQKKYAQKIIDHMNISSCKSSLAPIIHIMIPQKILTFTRPNISYVVQQICLFMHDPRTHHMTSLKRISH